MQLLLDSGHRSSLVALDSQLGMLCVGWDSRVERLRAVEGFSRRPAWEAPPVVVADVARPALALGEGGILYVANDLFLTALDARTGAPGWRVELPSAVQTNFGRPCIADPFPRGPRGAVVVQTEDEHFIALDRTNGRTLWSIPDAKDYGPLPTYFGVLLGARWRSHLALLLVDPLRGPEPVYALPSAFALSRHLPPNVVIGCMDIDGEGNPGVAVVEMPMGQARLQYRAPFDMKAGRPVVAGGLVFSADLLQFAGVPNGPVAPPEFVHGYNIRRLESTGTTLLGLFMELEGEGRLKVVGLDPRSLATRYFLEKELGTVLKLEEGQSNIATSGTTACVVGLRGDGLQLTVFHGDMGAVFWQRSLPGKFEALETRLGHFVLRTDEYTWIFRPEKQEPVGVFPFPL